MPRRLRRDVPSSHPHAVMEDRKEVWSDTKDAWNETKDALSDRKEALSNTMEAFSNRKEALIMDKVDTFAQLCLIVLH